MVWTRLVSFSIIRCLIAPLGLSMPVPGVIMIYNQAALWGSLLPASSVALNVWAAGFSAQFVNNELQQAASATPSKPAPDAGAPPAAVSDRRGSPKAWRVGDLGNVTGGVERQTCGFLVGEAPPRCV